MNFKNIVKKRSVFEYILYTVALLPGILLDIITKAMAVANLYPNKSVTVIDGVLSFTYYENTGAAWGMLKDAPWVFNSISIVAISAMLIYLYLGHVDSKLRAISISVIVSGGIGNMIERLGQGYVVDFIHATFIDFPIFNIADCCVCIGAGLLILSLILEIIDESKSAKTGRSKSAVPEDTADRQAPESEDSGTEEEE